MKSVWVNGESGTATGATGFHSPQGTGSQNATENVTLMVVTSDGSMSNLRVKFDTAPGAGKTWTCTLRKGATNGGAMANTALETVVSGTNQSNQDTTNKVAVVKGDRICLQLVPAGTPAASDVNFSMQFDSVQAHHSAWLFHVNNPSTAATRYFSPQGLNTSATHATAAGICPTSGKIKRVFVELSVAPGLAASWTYTLYKNGAATALTFSISDASAVVGDSGEATEISYAAGDNLSLESVPSATPAPAATQVEGGMTFVADTPGLFAFVTTTDGGITPTANRFHRVQRSGATMDATEGSADALADVMTFKNIYAQVNVATDAGKTWVLTLREAAASTTETVTITNGDGTAVVTASADEAVAADAAIATLVAPTATPATPTWMRVSYTATVSTAASIDEIVGTTAVRANVPYLQPAEMVAY